MRRESKAERDAWTAHIDGTQAPKTSKYSNVQAGKYQSKHEADMAQRLDALARSGKIKDLCEQVSFTLIPGNGKIRPIRYVADFTYVENGQQVVADAKGCKTPIYRMKRKMMALLHGITIEEL